MTAKSVRPNEARTTDLVDALRERGVSPEARPGGGRVVVTGHGRSMVLVWDAGWWAHERPTTGDTVRDRMHPGGMEWVTARAVASMLANGSGVPL